MNQARHDERDADEALEDRFAIGITRGPDGEIKRELHLLDGKWDSGGEVCSSYKKALLRGAVMLNKDASMVVVALPRHGTREGWRIFAVRTVGQRTQHFVEQTAASTRLSEPRPGFRPFVPQIPALNGVFARPFDPCDTNWRQIPSTIGEDASV